MAILSSKQILQDNNTRDHNLIRTLTLTHKALSDVSCLGEFKNLERLDLGFNALTSLEGLKSCVTLKWLSVVQNKLQSLKGIEGLTKLTVSSGVLPFISITFVLNLVGVVLSMLLCPKTRSFCVNVLNAGKNKIKSMEEVRSLGSLRALILNDNEITSFCKLDRMKELNTVVLSRNPIREIGDAFSKIKSVTKLSLSHCQLQMIGSSLTSCTELKELRLAHNDVKTLPVGLSHNPRLQNLDIGNNLITNWSDLKVLSSLVNLKNLNLQGNPIAEKENLPRKVKKLLPNLQIFNAKPIDKRMKKEDERSLSSSVNDGNKVDPDDGALDLEMEKELKHKKRKRNDLPNKQTLPLENANEEKTVKRKSKSKRHGDSVSGKSEDVLLNTDSGDESEYNKKKKDKASDREGNSTINGKSSKRSDRKLKQNKASVIDDGEAPFTELFATDASNTTINSAQEMDHLTVPDGDAGGGGVVTVTTKTKKINRDAPSAFLELSPVNEVGLGGPSTWDD